MIQFEPQDENISDETSSVKKIKVQIHRPSLAPLTKNVLS